MIAMYDLEDNLDNFKLIEDVLAKVILNQKKIIERLKKEGK